MTRIRTRSIEITPREWHGRITSNTPFSKGMKDSSLFVVTISDTARESLFYWFDDESSAKAFMMEQCIKYPKLKVIQNAYTRGEWIRGVSTK